MERILVAAVLLLPGCLIPNPEYGGQAATDSGGMSGSASGAATPDPQTSGLGTTGVESASGEAGESTGTTGTGQTASSTTGSGTTGSCPDGAALRVCLEFDVEDPADVVDESANEYPVSVAAGGVVEGPWLGAFEFSARTRVEVDCSGACAGGPTVTYEAWVRPEARPATGDRAGVVDNNGILGMFITDGYALRCVTDSATIEGGLLQEGEWAHLACVADGEILRAYVNGENVTEASIIPLAPTENPLPLGIGNNAPQFDAGVIGLIDRVRVWDEARTPDQLTAAATP